MADKQGAIDHLRELGDSLKDWEKYRKVITLDDLKKDRDKRNMAMHAQLISIQSAIDIANHIIAINKMRKPQTYRESFEILSDNDLITNEMAEELSELAGFRNVLVHIYWRLDIDQVYRMLQTKLNVLKEFAKQMAKLLL